MIRRIHTAVAVIVIVIAITATATRGTELSPATPVEVDRTTREQRPDAEQFTEPSEHTRGPSASPLPRDPEPVDGDRPQEPPPHALRHLSELPPELAKKIEKAYQRSRDAHENRNLPFPQARPRIALARVQSLVRLMEEVDASYHQFANAHINFLEEELRRDPSVRVSMEGLDSEEAFSTAMAKRFPGFPQGYTYILTDIDGKEFAGAWKESEVSAVGRWAEDLTAMGQNLVIESELSFIQFFTFGG